MAMQNAVLVGLFLDIFNFIKMSTWSRNSGNEENENV